MMTAAFLQRLLAENKAARESAERLTSRTVSAISKGDRDELDNILRDARLIEPSEESGAESLEAGDAVGASGVSIGESPPEGT